MLHMEANGGRPFPVIEELQTQNSFNEQTARASIACFEESESESYLARFTHQNETQTPVPCQTSYVEISSFTSLGAPQGPGIGGYLPRWDDRARLMESSMPPHDSPNSSQVEGTSFNHWGQTYSRKNNPLNQSAAIQQQQQGPDNLFRQWNNMKFSYLLGMERSELAVPMSGVKLGYGSSTGGSLIVDLNSPREESRYVTATTSWMENQGSLDASSQQISSKHTLGRQPSYLPSHHYGNPCDPNILQSTVNGNQSTFEPARCDHNEFSSERTRLSAIQAPYEQNKEQENQVAATRVDTRELQNEGERSPESDLLPGKLPTLIENHDPDKESNDGINLNKTPQQNPRRKKHRPKVVIEDKAKRAPTPHLNKSINPVEAPRTKRKYVRKNKPSASSTTPIGLTEVTDPNVPNPVAKSCRRSLKFNLDERVENHSSLPKSTYNSYSAQQADGTSRLVKTIPAPANGKAFVGHQDDTMGGNPAVAYAIKGCNTEDNEANSLRKESKSYGTNPSPVDGESRPKRPCSCLVEGLDEGTRELAATHGAVYSPSYILFGDGRINTMGNMLFPEICKKRRTEKVQSQNNSCTSSSATTLEGVREVALGQNNPGGNLTASKYYYQTPDAHFTPTINDLAGGGEASTGCRLPFINTWVDIEKLKKKRTKGPHARHLASFTRFAENNVDISLCNQAAEYVHNRVDVANSRQTCVEAYATGIHGPRVTKKRSRTRFVCSNQSNIKTVKLLQGISLDENHQHVGNASDAGSFLELPWRDMPLDYVTVDNVNADNIEDGLELPEMGRESNIVACPKESAIVPYNADRKLEATYQQMQNAVVLYQTDYSIVPIEGTLMKKQRERAKVDLDEETLRVWNLLLENIDNEGIDGTNEDKAKWWEKERRVFHGRVDSFIARMRLVQGDRRFSPWKGSVVDSVIGVFLTQNVSDHLSSSAFMSLAAQFQLKSKSKLHPHNKEGNRASPGDSALVFEGFDTWSAKISGKPVCGRSSRTIHDADHGLQRKDVNSREEIRGNIDLSPQDIAQGLMYPDYCESSARATHELAERHNNYIIDAETASTSEDARVMDDVASSQHPVLSSQKSANSPGDRTVGRMESCSESNSEVENLMNSHNHSYLGYPISCLGLLKMAQIPTQKEACTNSSIQDFFTQETAENGPKGRGNGYQQITERKEETHGGCLGEPSITRDSILHSSMAFQFQCASYSQNADEESRSSANSTTKDHNCAMERSDLTTNSTIHSPSWQNISEKVQIPISSAVNVYSTYVLEGERTVMQSQRQVSEPREIPIPIANELERLMGKTAALPPGRTPGEGQCSQVLHDTKTYNNIYMKDPGQDATGSAIETGNAGNRKQTKGKAGKSKSTAFDWDSLRKHAETNGRRERTLHTMDSLDYEAVRRADVHEISDTIKERGMNNRLAERIKDFLNRLVTEHGSIDLEWIRDVPPDKAKEYLLSIRGLGLKSVECVRLLTLHHLAFPVDTNVGRIAVRLGWVPLQPLPESLQLHLLELYPVLESIQKYLWPRLCKLDQRTLYELHYHMITFGKVFCTKRQPNCNACPLRAECRHFASAFASARLALPGLEQRSIVTSSQCAEPHKDPQATIGPFPLALPQAERHLISTQSGLAYKDPPVILNPQFHGNQPASSHPCLAYQDSQVNISHVPLPIPLGGQNLDAIISNCEPIIEVPASPEPEKTQLSEGDMEDMFSEDPNEIPTININMKQLSQTLESYMQSNMELQQSEISKALVTLTAEAASIPMQRLKNVSRLRTEHHVYELPDDHPLLEGLDKREPDDPCSYLLAIWSPGETANSTQPPDRRCSSSTPGQLCNDEACFHCSSQQEANCQIVRGTLLIPCRTAMRGSFPLNGTYFQVNEVFADHDSSLNPIVIPRDLLWKLHRRTVYFGTSIPTIFRGLSTEGIQHCFQKGYVCVRGFDQKTRAPRPLMARLHFPVSKMTGAKGNPKQSGEPRQQ